MKVISFLSKFIRWFLLSTLVWVIVISTSLVIDERKPETATAGVYSSENFTIIFEEVSAKDAEQFANNLERERAYVIELFGLSEMPHVIAYLYPKGSVEFSDHRFGIEGEADGFVFGGDLDTMYVTMAPVEQDGIWHEAGQEQVTRAIGGHELRHLAVSYVQYQNARTLGEVRSKAQWEQRCRYLESGCRLPSWLNESLASEGTRGWSERIFTDYPTRGDLLAPTTFTRDEYYSYGKLVAEFILKTWSKDEVRALIISNGDIEQSLGITEEEFNAQFRTYASERLNPILNQYNAFGTVIY